MGKLTRCAFVFAGQGAQSPGMGQSLAAASHAACKVFEHVDLLRPGTSDMCFFGQPDELMQTINTQPCVWAVEMAAVAALEEAGITAQAAAGFSLGEMAALAYSGAASFDEVFALVCARARHMEKAASQHEAGMAAVMKLDAQTIEELCEHFESVWPVNYNCPGQIVVAGLNEQLKEFAVEVKAAGGLARPLKVSSAFHSPLMQEASRDFGEDIEQVTLSEPRIALYSNVTGKPQSQADIALLLQRQMACPVRWQDTIEHLVAEQGIDTFVEVGPGATLSGLIRRIAPEARTLNVCDEESLTKTVEVLTQ